MNWASKKKIVLLLFSLFFVCLHVGSTQYENVEYSVRKFRYFFLLILFSLSKLYSSTKSFIFHFFLLLLLLNLWWKRNWNSYLLLSSCFINDTFAFFVCWFICYFSSTTSCSFIKGIENFFNLMLYITWGFSANFFFWAFLSRKMGIFDFCGTKLFQLKNFGFGSSEGILRNFENIIIKFYQFYPNKIYRDKLYLP